MRAGLSALTVWSVSGGKTMVFSMVFITSFHSSFNTRFSTVFSQILANRVRLAGGGDRRSEGKGRWIIRSRRRQRAILSWREGLMRQRQRQFKQKKRRWLFEILACLEPFFYLSQWTNLVLPPGQWYIIVWEWKKILHETNLSRDKSGLADIYVLR